jgi:hypothetical protein
MALGVHNTGADRHEFENVFVPFEPLDRQLDPNDAIGAHVAGFFAHARHRQLARLIHGLRQDAEFLVRGPAAVLNAEVIDAGADAQPDRLEPRLADEQELVDGEVRGEDTAGLTLAAQAAQALDRVRRDILDLAHIAPSSSRTG